jgi:hypothetical protein
MKIITTIAVALLFASRTDAQTATLQPVLEQYITIKDALVKSDAVRTAAFAGQLVKTINGITVEGLQQEERKAFEKQKAGLVKAAEKISKSGDLEKQRAAFSTLSTGMWNLVKVAESITVTVYYQYCPMKKSYWLSLEPVIKNPYYGADMLVCGNIDSKI